MNTVYVIILISVIILTILYYYKRSDETGKMKHRYIIAVDAPEYINNNNHDDPLLIYVNSSIKYDEAGLNKLKDDLSKKLNLLNKDSMRIIYKGYE